MDNYAPSLPWDRLECGQDSIPWPAMRTFADTLATDRRLIPRLIEVYDRAYEMLSDETGCGDFYVAGIFVLAAPFLDEETRREIGSLLVERLVQAGRDDADISLEVLMGAAGAMGPAVLPAVLDALAAEPDTRGAWLFLWGLTVLAGKTDDPDLRDRVVRACVETLERADRGQIDLWDAGWPALTLAILNRTEHTELIRRLCDRSTDTSGVGEYTEALDILENRSTYGGQPELWERPVEEWLPPRCRMAEASDDEDDQAEEYDEYEEYEEGAEGDEDPAYEIASLIAGTFAKSPVACTLPEELRKDAYTISECVLYESIRVLDRAPARWDEPTLRRVLVDLVPARLPAEAKILEKVIPTVEAMLHWFQFDGLVANGDSLARVIHGWTDQVVAAGMASKNQESHKPLLVEAMAAGLDPLNPAFSQAFTGQRPGESPGAVASEPPREEAKPGNPPISIVEHRMKTARNAPCPCGSGKKYKKCHGRSKTETPAD
jgi:hypothetical protein